MKKFKVVIVDDEKECITAVQQALTAYPEFETAGTASDARTGICTILNEMPDMVFVDVEMPGESGLEMIRDIQERVKWDMHVVFYTAYPRYMQDAFKVSAFDFLLKPFNDEDFKVVMNHWFAHQKSTQNNQAGHPKPIRKPYIVSSDEGYRLCKIEQVVYMEYMSDRKVWSARLIDNTMIYFKRGSSAADLLKLHVKFVQVNQYCIINYDFLSAIVNNVCMLIPPYEATQFKITRTFLRNIEDKFEEI